MNIRCVKNLPVFAIGLTGLLLAGGCKVVGPSYTSPKTAVPDAWQTAALKGFTDAKIPFQTWWQAFQDPALDTLIADVSTNNLDLAAAVARVDEAAARYGYSKIAEEPQVDGVGGMTRTRNSERIRTHATQNDNPYWLYDVGFTMSWELDVWGRVQRSIESARGQWEASQEDLRDVQVIIQADTAATYVNVRTLQQRLAYARSNVALQEATLKLTRDRQNAGLTGELDVRQAELNLATTRALIPQLEAQLDQALNRLCLLSGKLPGTQKHLLQTAARLREVTDLPALLPAELLRRRPDVRAAERRLASQTALIGVATAELYPAFTLNGSFEWQASESGNLLNPQSRTYGIGPSFRWNLLNRDRIKDSIKSEEALTRQALAAYEKTVLTAYQESEDALSAYANELTRLGALREAVTAATRSVALVDTLYRNGLTDFQNVLDTQRALFQQQDALAAAQGSAAQNLIAIYKAFGGGWEEPQAEKTDAR
jgi:NodT family efflux transporter outer membrane factor (OMF) lipoprotein